MRDYKFNKDIVNTELWRTTDFRKPNSGLASLSGGLCASEAACSRSNTEKLRRELAARDGMNRSLYVTCERGLLYGARGHI